MPALPFPVNDVSADLDIRDGLLTIKRAEGTNGSTMLRASGELGVGKQLGGRLDLRVDLVQLELDDRIKECTPPNTPISGMSSSRVAKWMPTSVWCGAGEVPRSASARR